ncbi:hypothetical protein ANCCAN_30057, partial [Ancylostoma caninum]
AGEENPSHEARARAGEAARARDRKHERCPVEITAAGGDKCVVTIAQAYCGIYQLLYVPSQLASCRIRTISAVTCTPQSTGWSCIVDQSRHCSVWRPHLYFTVYGLNCSACKE